MKYQMNSRRGITVFLSLLLLLALSVPAFADDVTGSGTVTGGSLGVVTSDNPDFGSAALTGEDKAVTDDITIAVSDATGTGAGWKLQIAATAFTTTVMTTTKQLPANALSITAVSAVADGGTTTEPTNAIGYPLVLTAGAAALPFFNAAVNTGMGNFIVTPTFRLAILAKAYAGAYASTITITIISAP